MAGTEGVRGFHSTFASFGRQGFAPHDWEHHFLEYDPSEWLSEGDGVLQFFSDDCKRYSLTIVHCPARGFVLQFDCRSLEKATTIFCQYAATDLTALSQFDEVEDGLTYPTGCIVTPTLAWNVVKDFLTNPTHPSDKCEWIADEDIAWPKQ